MLLLTSTTLEEPSDGSVFSIMKKRFLIEAFWSGFKNILTFVEFKVRERFSSYKTKGAKVPIEL
jgi:hypothetical protein